jgi:hypothetical protein
MGLHLTKGQYRYKISLYMPEGKHTVRRPIVTRDKETSPTKSGKTRLKAATKGRL